MPASKARSLPATAARRGTVSAPRDSMLKAKQVAMKRSLDEYNRKRHFGRTSEPRGEKQQHEGFSFVVQKHDATRLHYDFRLELDGVLLSWAVPKGPSLDPGVKRMAVQTEDHPVEYGGFEGVIPKGEYGGGSVVVWDRGHWVPDGDPRADYQRGRLTFRLEGEKLKGASTSCARASKASSRVGC
jgi:bifunctional non-homologous end joining protein LigD